MSGETAHPGTAVRMTADLTGRDIGSSLAGLIDFLDRADGVAGSRTARRPAAARPAALRSGSEIGRAHV